MGGEASQATRMYHKGTLVTAGMEHSRMQRKGPANLHIAPRPEKRTFVTFMIGFKVTDHLGNKIKDSSSM